MTKKLSQLIIDKGNRFSFDPSVCVINGKELITDQHLIFNDPSVEFSVVSGIDFGVNRVSAVSKKYAYALNVEPLSGGEITLAFAVYIRQINGNNLFYQQATNFDEVNIVAVWADNVGAYTGNENCYSIPIDGARIETDANSALAGELSNLVVTWRGGSDVEVWCNGKQIANSFANGTPNTFPTGQDRIRVAGAGLLDSFNGGVIIAASQLKSITSEQARVLSKDVYQFLKQDATVSNNGLYSSLFSSSASAITGTGVPQAATATSAGFGSRIIIGTGIVSSSSAVSNGAGAVGSNIIGSGNTQAITASSSGTAAREIKSSSLAQAEAATSVGLGSAFSVVVGSGSAQAGTASASGSGNVGAGITGSGNVNASPSTALGLGARIITGFGSAEAANASSFGLSGGAKVGSGTPQSDAASSSGVGKRNVFSIGSAQCNAAASSGIGGLIVNGSGAAQAQTAASLGAGGVPLLAVGSGIVRATAATCIGFDSMIEASTCNTLIVPEKNTTFMIRGC